MVLKRVVDGWEIWVCTNPECRAVTSKPVKKHH
jgi:hypothetical protein